MNILILSPGRRVEVVEYFKEVFHRDGGLVYTLDMSPYAPALYFGDKYFCVEKDFNHIERYVQNIIFICENYGIKSVISLIDPELVLLSQYQGEFDKFGIKTILSDIRFTESTFDKYVFYQKYKDTIRLIPTVESYSEAHKMIESREWSYPIFAKLRDGSASIGICKIDTEDDFAITRNNDKYIYQPFIEGIEYGVDVYFDLISGELISVFIKRKLAMRAGETDKSISVKSAKILSEILKVGKISGIRGPVDVDVFVSNRGEVFINEINPRFGGGYPHAYQCGVNFMELIMNNLKGIVNKPQFNNYEEDVILLKYSFFIPCKKMINHVYIIAEAGVNHNGRLDLALQLCNAAKDAGADAVKFQTWKTEKIVTRNAELAVYQENNISDKTKSQFKMLKELELSYDNFEVVKNHCDEIGIQFLSTPDEIDSLDFLCNFNLPFIKLGSGDVTNIPFLRLVGSRHIDVVLSTGMSYLGDVEIAYRTLIEAGAKSVSLLHCTTNYPCPMHEVNLRAIQTLKDAFHCSVGYSDHTMGVEVPVAAVAMGAEIIEKHFTLDKEMDGPDHKASLNPEELKQMVVAIRHIEQALGDGIKQPNESEKQISEVVLKRIVAATPIKEGEVLSADNMTVKRSTVGLKASLWDLVNGRIATCNYAIDEPIII